MIAHLLTTQPTSYTFDSYTIYINLRTIPNSIFCVYELINIHISLINLHFSDAVAGQLPDIIKSVFAAAKQFKKGSFLKKVIFVVDPEIISVAYKTVEGIFMLVISIIY